MSAAALPAAAVHPSPVPRLRLTDWRFLVAMAAVGVLMLAVSIRTARQVERDALVINVAGQQRMLVQKATAEYLAALVMAGEPRYSVSGATARLFERTLAVLMEGGTATFEDRSVSLQPTTSRAFRAALEEAGASWEELRRALGAHPSDPAGNASAQRLAELHRVAGRTVELMGGAVRVYEEEASARAARLRGIQLALVPLWFGVLGIGLVGERRARASEAELRGQLEARERQQRAAAELGRSALDGCTLDELFDRVVATVREVLGVEYAKIMELSPDGASLLLRAGVGWKPGYAGRATVDARETTSQAGYTLAAAAPVVVTDFREERRFTPPLLLVEHDVGSGISVTIPGEERPFGVLGVHSVAPRRFTDDDAGFVQMVANILASAIAREKAEAELRLLWASVAMLNDMVVITDAEPRPHIVFVNSAFKRRTGYSAAEVIGRTLSLLQGPGSDEVAKERMRRAFAAGEPFREEIVNYTKDGAAFWVELDIVPMRNEKGVITHWVSVQRDVTADKQAEEALRRSEARYRSLVDGAAYGIYRSSLEGKFLQVNPALVAMLGYASEEELLAVDVARDVYQEAEERRQLIDRHREAERIEGVVVHWKRKGGRPLTVRLSGRALLEAGALQEFEMIVEDVTQRQALEEQLRQAQKMDAVGRLAGGVAHDFNNLLTVIMAETEMALESPVVESDVRGSLLEIRRAGTSAAALTRQLLAFSRKQVLEHETFALNDLVSQLDKMLRRLIGEHIEVAMNLSPDAGSVRADRAHLEQVLVNLAVNARDSMPNGGRLLLETAAVSLDADYAAMHANVAAGAYLMLVVSDTGTGMTEEVRSHLFEPFFTTKERDRGTGLGLATSYGIVKQCGGHIAVHSEPGLGTTMRIYLPRVDEPATAGVVEAATSPGGQETILLVEDDGAVRAVAARILAAHGYTVLQAENGEEALRLAEARREPIDLLLADAVLPGIGGRELVRLMKAARPGIAVLCASGYADEVMVRDRLMDGEVALIQKPFTPNGLARKVRDVLDAR